jgi:membrane dipeptidase
LEHVIAHIDHVCQLLGSAQHVGLGTDFDGGVGLHLIPRDLDSIADIGLIGQALLRRGYRSADVDAILAGNWLRVLRTAFKER